MTRQEIIFDIIMILTKAGFTDDSRLEPDYIGYKIDEKRAKEIRDSYNRNSLIDPMWLQDYGVIDFTEVNYADDKSFSFLDCKLAKATLPAVISFQNSLSSANNLGVYSLRSLSGREEYFFEEHSKLMDILTDLPTSDPLRKFSYYTKIHNAIYAVSKDQDKVPEKLRAILILERPLEGYFLTTENVTVLIVGTLYEVVAGQIIHNSIPYNEGQSFTAVDESFTGTGLVQYKNQKRPLNNEDPYPFSASQMEVVILKLLTQEYGIEATRIAEIRNNSQDELKVLSQPAI
jgi:hypothetical protein